MISVNKRIFVATFHHSIYVLCPRSDFNNDKDWNFELLMKRNIPPIKLQFRNWPKGLLKTGAPNKDDKILVGQINYPSAPSLVTPYFKEYISVDACETCFKIKLFSEFQHEDVY